MPSLTCRDCVVSRVSVLRARDKHNIPASNGNACCFVLTSRMGRVPQAGYAGFAILDESIGCARCPASGMGVVVWSARVLVICQQFRGDLLEPGCGANRHVSRILGVRIGLTLLFCSLRCCLAHGSPVASAVCPRSSRRCASGGRIGLTPPLLPTANGTPSVGAPDRRRVGETANRNEPLAGRRRARLYLDVRALPDWGHLVRRQPVVHPMRKTFLLNVLHDFLVNLGISMLINLDTGCSAGIAEEPRGKHAAWACQWESGGAGRTHRLHYHRHHWRHRYSGHLGAGNRASGHADWR